MSDSFDYYSQLGSLDIHEQVLKTAWLKFRFQENKESLREALDEYKRLVHNKDKVGSNLYAAKAADWLKTLERMGIAPTKGLAAPEGAVLLQFEFTLAKKFMSRDDQAFYPHENPIRKEHVFKVPMVAASSWKGSLRRAAVANLVDRKGGAEERMRLLHLFGDEKSGDNERDENALQGYLDRVFRESNLLARYREELQQWFGEEEQRRRGRLIFYPTYFGCIELDVINPRKASTRAGTQPIFFEIVPPKTTGFFQLLYFPFDLLGRTKEERALEAGADWALILEALHRMLFFSGFGAKTGLGCGKAEDVMELRFDSEIEGFSPPAERLTAADEYGGSPA